MCSGLLARKDPMLFALEIKLCSPLSSVDMLCAGFVLIFWERGLLSWLLGTFALEKHYQYSIGEGFGESGLSCQCLHRVY